MQHANTTKSKSKIKKRTRKTIHHIKEACHNRSMKTQTYMMGIIALSIIFAIVAYTILPETVAIHWNAEGQADGYSSSFWGALFFPILIAAMYTIYVILPKLDPLQKNIESFHEWLAKFMMVLQLFFLYLFALFIAFNMGHSFNFIQWMAPGFTFLLFAMGTFLPHVKRNYFVGFRTPWTLENDDVWEQTHKHTGRMFRIFAFLPIAGFFAPEGMIFWIIFAFLVPSIYGLAFSYVYYRRIQLKTGSVKQVRKGIKR